MSDKIKVQHESTAYHPSKGKTTLLNQNAPPRAKGSVSDGWSHSPATVDESYVIRAYAR